jgi:2-polyprenyl-6-methoxyphenol hydroxylase-like FAD-dependent oxidoreductase
MQRIGERAVVLGAGVAGLLAARVLSDAYDEVSVIDRDSLPGTAGHRRGVPQDRHAHLLVGGGTQVLDRLFTGLFDDLTAAGVPVVRDFAEIRFAPGGDAPLSLRGRPEEPFLCQASRPFLEAHLRARVRALPNVELVEHRDAVGLVAIAAGDRVTGVRVLPRTVGGVEEIVDADLVLDATGRGSRAPAWLATLGYEPPREQRLTIDLMYGTRHLRLRPGALDAKLVGVGARPDRPTGMVLLAQEGDRSVLTFFGYEGHHPSRDPAGFLDFVEAIAPPDVFAAIRDAEPLDDIGTYRFPANVRRRYERLRRFPAGFLVFGDAICSTNPAYALGMSVSALQAASLAAALADGERDLARRFFAAAAGPVDMAWQAVVGADLALPQVPGRRPLSARVIGGYFARAMRAAEHDPVVAHQFLRVASLQDPSARMLRPAIALHVQRDALRRLLATRRRRSEAGERLSEGV